MKVENSYVIGGVAVKFMSEFSGIRVYQEGDDSHETLYFSRDGKVVKKLIVSVDCGQNEGYIDDLYFMDIKE